MSDFLVHVVPGSPFARAVLVTLEEKRTGYRLARVMPGTLRSAEHLRRFMAAGFLPPQVGPLIDALEASLSPV